MDVQAAQSIILRITGQILPARCIAIAAELGISDKLAQKPMTAEELANACDVHAPSLFRLLRFLASIEIYHQDTTGHFRNTDASEVLRDDVAGSVRSMVRTAWQDVIWETYKELPKAMKTGQTAFTLAHGSAFFDKLAAEPDLGTLFDASMALMSNAENTIIASAYPFGEATDVIDIGGGRGGLLAEILKLHTNLKGILFDQSHVLSDPQFLKDANLMDRCALVAGNFFSDVPAHHDIYLLKRILHDWSDKAAVRILKNVKAALKPESRIAVIDAVIQPGNASDPNKYLDVGIMALLDGRERTAEDFESLFTQAGLQILRILPPVSPSTMSIVEGALA
ncbi:MAG: methyltransferase [Rhodospirillaceae bacterium]